MKFTFLTFLLIFGACNGGGSSKPKVSSGEIAASQTTKTFVKNTHNEIPSSLQVNESDLDTLAKEGLITPEEASQISENL